MAVRAKIPVVYFVDGLQIVEGNTRDLEKFWKLDLVKKIISSFDFDFYFERDF